MDSGYKRGHKVGSLIQEEVMSILRRDVTDPRIGFVTVTHVEMTDDLGLAKIYISVMGDEQARESALKGLKSAAGYIRHLLSSRLNLRLAPEIMFKYDVGLEQNFRVLDLLGQIQQEKERQAELLSRKKKRSAALRPRRKKIVKKRSR